MKRFVFAVAVVSLFSVGCASTSENLQRETARYIGDIAPDQVNVTNVQRGVTDVKWEAETPQGVYSCSADDMVRRTYCVKR
ncbi:MAG: hypothetical protein ACREYF_11395 [Gammaproteobacteria bacterium]